ncbi:MAG TPA: hypothetical protein VHQ47_18515 [Phycisphaerae bacterium]|nr:hypothetical protein [Phycisphaerae bacterium]
MPHQPAILLLPLLALIPLPARAQTAPAPASIYVNRALPMSLSAFTDETPLVDVTRIVESSSDKLVADTLAAVKHACDALKSVHVTGYFYEEQFDSLHKQWLEAGSIQGEGFFDFATSRYRFDVTSHYDDWAYSPHARDEKFLQVFDGKNVRQVPPQYVDHHFSGPPTPAPQSAMSVLGDAFAFPFHLGVELTPDNRTHEYVLYPRIDPASTSARRVILNDAQPAIELTFHYTNVNAPCTETWYLDPDHGYALIASSRAVGKNNAFISQAVIFRLLPLGNGLFYPQRGIRIIGDSRSAHSRAIFTASSVSANESKPDSFFTLATPPTP